MNSAYFGAGWLALTLDKRASLESLRVENCHLVVSIGGLVLLMVFQIGVRCWLISTKSKRGH